MPAERGADRDAAFDLIGVTRTFGRTEAVSAVTLRVAPGERVAVIGPSGAGKSTLLRLLNTSLAATSGEVRVLGDEPARLGPRALRALRARIGTIYQHLHLVPQASVLENVLMGRLGRAPALSVVFGALRRAERHRVAGVLGRVGLSDRMHARVGRLSGGEQQRVAVARVLYQEPDAIVADEPFSSVDPVRTADVIALLLDAARGRALVLATHQLEPVLPHFGRVVGIRAGRLLFDRPREALTPDDLAELYQPDASRPSPEPRRALQAPPAEPQGVLTVGASTTPGEYILPALLPSFAKRHPGVRVRLTVKDTGEITRDLLAGEVELAFVGSRVPHPALSFEDFAEDEIVLVASPVFTGIPPEPLAPSALSRLPRVEREPGSATRAVVEAQLAAMGVGLDPEAVVFEAGSVEALKGAVAAGLGVGFVSRLSVIAELRAGRLRVVRVAALRVPRRVFVASRRTEPLSPAAQAFLEVMRSAWPAGDAAA